MHPHLWSRLRLGPVTAGWEMKRFGQLHCCDLYRLYPPENSLFYADQREIERIPIKGIAFPSDSNQWTITSGVNRLIGFASGLFSAYQVGEQPGGRQDEKRSAACSRWERKHPSPTNSTRANDSEPAPVSGRGSGVRGIISRYPVYKT